MPATLSELVESGSEEVKIDKNTQLVSGFICNSGNGINRDLGTVELGVISCWGCGKEHNVSLSWYPKCGYIVNNWVTNNEKNATCTSYAFSINEDSVYKNTISFKIRSESDKSDILSRFGETVFKETDETSATRSVYGSGNNYNVAYIANGCFLEGSFSFEKFTGT